MGSDDDIDWQPKPVKPKYKHDLPNGVTVDSLTHIGQSQNRGRDPLINSESANSNNNNNSIQSQGFTYHATFNGIRQIIKASSIDEILKNLKLKYNLLQQPIRVNYWSDSYQEWLCLDSLPQDNAKLQVLLMDSNNNNSENNKNQHGLQIKNEEELNQIIRNELIKYLEPINFAKHMNQTLKYYVESNKQDMLNHFEQSVHYINKRYNQNHSSPSKEILHIQQQQQDTILRLQDEAKSLQGENKKLKQMIDDLRKDMETFEYSFEKQQKSTRKQRSGGCAII